MEHECTHEADFATLFTKLDNLILTVSAQTVVITDLIKFQSSLQAIEGYREKQALSTRQRAGIIVSGIIGFSSIVCTIIIKFA